MSFPIVNLLTKKKSILIPPMIKSLIKKKNMLTPIPIASKHGDLKKNTLAPILVASKRGNLKMIDSLIKAGTDIYAQDKYGFTCIHHAAINGHKDVVNFLIEKGVNVDVRNKYNYTALHCVVIAAKDLPVIEIRKNIIDILVENKADVNAKDKDGNTPLHHAAIRGNTDIIETLIKQGANPLLKNINNEIPKDLWGDSGYDSSVVSTPRKQSQESVTNISPVFQSTPIKQPSKKGGDEYLLNCNLSMISKPSSTFKQNIDPIISEVDQYVQSNYLQEHSTSEFTERSELIYIKNESSKLNYDEQETKDLSQTIKQSKDDYFKQYQHKSKDKRSYIFNCVAGGGVGLAVAYFVGAALTSIYVAISVFVGMAFVGALLGYGIAKLCDKVETKIESPCQMEKVKLEECIGYYRER